MQIRTRLTLLFALITAGILAGVLFAVYVLFEKNAEDTFYASLESKVEMTAQTALRDPATFRPSAHLWYAPDEDTLPYRDNISIYNDAYERVFSLHPEAPPVSVKELEDIYRRRSTRFEHYNLLAIGKMSEGPTGHAYAVVAEGYCDPGQLIQLRNILLIAFFAGLLLVAIGGWYYAGQALAPMSDIVEEVEHIQPADLSRRVENTGSRDEIGRLAETFNRLLDRVEEAFRMQRMFISNVSHELRNPLTAIRAQLEVALQREREPEAYRHALKSVFDDIQGLTEMEEELLQLAQIHNAPSAIPFAALRLDELLWQSRQQLQKRHPDCRAQVEFSDMPELEDRLLIRGNEPLLSTALLNLMNNACKYSPDGQVLLRASFRDNGAHVVEVCDNGPGIPPEEQRLIFEPFYRSARHIGIKGTGIGLSLVQSILTLHQIRLSVESPPGGGAIFRLEFPESDYLGSA
jgi:signal transduction histidine kinase